MIITEFNDIIAQEHTADINKALKSIATLSKAPKRDADS